MIQRLILIWASRNGHLKVVKYLVSLGFDPKIMENCLIQIASRNGDLEMAKYLVEIGCDPKDDNDLAIRFAIENGHLEILKYLVSLGCDPKAEIKLSHSWACKNYDFLKYLFEIGYDRENIKKSIKYKVLQESKNKLLIFMQTVKANKYLKMEILKLMFPQFTYNEILNVLN